MSTHKTNSPAGCAYSTGCLIVTLLLAALFVIAFQFALWAGRCDCDHGTSTYPDPAPIIAELKAEIAAREAELDQLADTLQDAVAERDEAVALLRQLNNPDNTTEL